MAEAGPMPRLQLLGFKLLLIMEVIKNDMWYDFNKN